MVSPRHILVVVLGARTSWSGTSFVGHHELLVARIAAKSQYQVHLFTFHILGIRGTGQVSFPSVVPTIRGLVRPNARDQSGGPR